MKKYLTLFFSLFYLVALSQSDIISAGETAKLIKSNKNVKIIDAGKGKAYSAAHLKNAISVNHKDLYKAGDVPGIIKSPQALSAYFRSKGISEKNTIIVYDEGSQKYACRVYWILKYLGVPDVKVLHKDNAAWKKARLVQTSQKPRTAKTVFVPHVSNDVYATLEETEEAIKDKGTVIVDAREKKYFTGADEASDGHIPTAVNIPWNEVETASGAFKTKEALTDIFSSKGVTPGKKIIVYCATGIKATVIYTALTQILGYKNVKVYDGAYEEWWSLYKPLVK
jgi:thiosulfate/3-mercaptopyruvate sulfurtransferase